uniref:RNA 3'-terminal phosphate cyclase-like protein n=1 Tax=Timema cristinae TaxID=61476 RepID=A0A7R9CJA0_TIMCR|nr:unnamed protein product [Timema cristinae]
MAPEGGGEVRFRCPLRRTLKPVHLIDSGKINRVRGTVYAVRVSPAIANRVVDSAKGILLQFLPDIYIYTDHNKGAKSGKSPGFGVCLVAQTTNGVYYTAEAVSNASGSTEAPSVPEEIGKLAAFRLLEEIYRGGCVDSTYQSLATVLMALAPKDVSKYLMGPLSPYTIQCLRHIKDFFGLTFKLETHTKTEDEEKLNFGGPKVLTSCIGVGYVNYSKKTM